MRHVEYMREMRNACKILPRNAEANRSLRRLKHGCENNNKMHLKKISCENVDCNHALHDAVHCWAICDQDNESSDYRSQVHWQA